MIMVKQSATRLGKATHFGGGRQTISDYGQESAQAERDIKFDSARRVARCSLSIDAL